MPSLFLIAGFFAETGLGIEIRQYDTHEGPQEDTLKGQVAFPFAKDEAGENCVKRLVKNYRTCLLTVQSKPCLKNTMASM